MSQPSDPFAPPPPGAPGGPGGYHGQPGGYPGPPDHWRDNGGLVTTLTVSLGLIALTLLVNAGALVWRSVLAGNATSGADLDVATGAAADRWVEASSVVYLLLMLVTIVLFISWQYRHARNARMLGQDQGLGPGWAIGGWFIPLANFVLPAVQLRGSSRWSAAPQERPGGSSGLIVPWMAALVAGNILVNAAARGEPNTSEGPMAYLDWLATSDRVDAGGTVLLIVAAVLASLMVRRLTADQDRQRPTATGMPWPGPPQPQPTAYPWGGPSQQGGPPPPPPGQPPRGAPGG